MLAYLWSYDIVGDVRLVLDANVVVAGMRSPTGASASLLRAARQGRVALLANVALAFEYEATCGRAEHRLAAELSAEEVQVFVDAVIAMVEPVPTHFLWRPRLRDAGDEMVLEAAVNGRADAIVTFNTRDFSRVLGEFGVEVWRPAEALKQMKSKERS